MIKLTAPNGTAVAIDPDQIAMVYPNPGSWHPDVKTVVVCGSFQRGVLETMEEIEALTKD